MFCHKHVRRPGFAHTACGTSLRVDWYCIEYEQSVHMVGSSRLARCMAGTHRSTAVYICAHLSSPCLAEDKVYSKQTRKYVTMKQTFETLLFRKRLLFISWLLFLTYYN